MDAVSRYEPTAADLDGLEKPLIDECVDFRPAQAQGVSGLINAEGQFRGRKFFAHFRPHS